MRIDDTELRTLLRLVEATRERELDCDELLQRAGRYVEAIVKGGKLKGFETVVQHLEQCPECTEEIDALLDLFRDERRPEKS